MSSPPPWKLIGATGGELRAEFRKKKPRAGGAEVRVLTMERTD
jgi:hypothetical protein